MDEFVITEDFPDNEMEFDQRFGDEPGCIEYLFRLRWPEGFVCPKCRHPKCWESVRGLYICCSCEYQQSVTAGTIFHATRKPLAIWFKAMWWFSTRKSGINAIDLRQLLGLGSYKTAWEWLQKLRSCTIRNDREKLSGDIEADEFYLGGESSGKRGRGAEHKCAVAVAVERKGNVLGRLRMQVITSCTAEELIPFVTGNVISGSTITTDGWKSYNRLEEEGYCHKKVIQSKEEDKDSVLPGVHLVASLVKRLILGTFQGRFDEKYLQRYLDEYVFRFNRRTTKSVGKRFWRIVQCAVASKPMTGKQVVFAGEVGTMIPAI
jgi:transposase-like protein